jgi:3-deoxy-D-arabino-heptulosonate 7-phosphate (DAHP) synthase
MTSLHIIGPCSLESWEQIQPVAQLATNLGIGFLRMQIFKPRTRLKSFQGLGVEGLEIFKLVRQNFPHLKFVSEACSMEHLRVLQNQVEVLQIGARNMQNFELLKEVARLFEKSSWNYVLLKRGFANTFEEWMGAVEYLE